MATRRSGPLALLVTADTALSDDVRRIAALAGAEVAVSRAFGSGWRATPLLLVGADVAADDTAVALVSAGSRGSGDVVVVAPRERADAAWSLAAAVSAAGVAVLPDAAEWLLDRLQDGAGSRPERGCVVAVVGGCGGAGASTVAATLALAAPEPAGALLVDADTAGGGVDLLLGLESDPGARWEDLRAAAGVVDPDALRRLLPGVDDVHVVAATRGVGPSPTAMAAVLDAGARGWPLVVVDVPRPAVSDDDAQGDAAVWAVADVALVTVPPRVRAVAAAAVTTARLRERCADVRLVVTGASPGDLAVDEVAAALALPLAGRCRAASGVPAAAEAGRPPGRRERRELADLARLLATDPAARP